MIELGFKLNSNGELIDDSGEKFPIPLNRFNTESSLVLKFYLTYLNSRLPEGHYITIQINGAELETPKGIKHPPAQKGVKYLEETDRDIFRDICVLYNMAADPKKKLTIDFESSTYKLLAYLTPPEVKTAKKKGKGKGKGKKQVVDFLGRPVKKAKKAKLRPRKIVAKKGRLKLK